MRAPQMIHGDRVACKPAATPQQQALIQINELGRKLIEPTEASRPDTRSERCPPTAEFES